MVFFNYIFMKIRKILIYILKYEGRKPLLHCAYPDTRKMMNIFKKPDGYDTLNARTQRWIDKWLKYYENLDEDDMAEDDPFDKNKYTADLLKSLNEIRTSLFASFQKYFSEGKATIKLFKNCCNLNPYNKKKDESVLDALSEFRHGPNAYGNQLDVVRQFEKEYTHYRLIICGYWNGNEIEEENFIDLQLNDEYLLSYDEKKELTKIKKDFDIISFWSAECLKKYKLLSPFSIDVLDHPLEDVDQERLMSLLQWINSNPKTKHLGIDCKAARLLSLWNRWIINRFC